MAFELSRRNQEGELGCTRDLNNIALRLWSEVVRQPTAIGVDLCLAKSEYLQKFKNKAHLGTLFMGS
jgi:hypothetical protein